METKNLAVHNLYSGYGRTDILKNISFEARQGEILAVTGPNGCGKSTLLKTLARLLPYRGSILLEGQDISSLSRKSLARKIAFLTQDSGIYFPFSVYDTAALGRFPHSRSLLKGLSAEDEKIISHVLDRLELREIKDRLINELSGGQLQRVFLARALIQDPDIILLDEPTNHLDLKHQVELLSYLSLWAKENKRTVIAVLHDLNLARRYADTAALLYNGTLVSIGKCESVLSGNMLTEIYGIDIRAFMLESLQMWRKEF
jgi:iron complex transport system ATP-binding protein